MQPSLLRFFLLTPLCLTASLLSQHFEVISGSAKASQSGNLTIIENSPDAILHWDHFSIGAPEHLHFVQVNAASTVLNRVTGSNISSLMGTLTSNGQVYLLNPNGVLIGPNAVIQTAGFLASTANLSNDQFLAGKELLFTLPGDGKIINQGTISCDQGNIFLIAKDVVNEGTCSADFIGIGSALEVLIQPQSSERLYIRPDPVNVGEVVNTGTLEALVIELKSSSAYEKAIRVDAPDAKLTTMFEGGRIILSAESGGVEVGGALTAAGGEVHVLGNSISLSPTARIDVSSNTCGGTVLIGGDYQGKNPDVPNAQVTFMAYGAEIAADALIKGNGGKVILWADDTTLFNGKISARGGLEGGDGGFVETSGKETLGVKTGFVNASAPFGKVGEWLLDPAAIIIATGGADTVASGSSPNCATAGAITIDPATLNAAAASISLCSQNGAGSSITISNNITLTTPGAALTMTAGSGGAGTISIAANITTTGGALTFNGNVNLGATITNRALDTTNAGSNAGADIFFSRTIAAGSGNTTQVLTLTAGVGTVTFTGLVGLGLQWGTLTVASASTINIVAGGGIGLVRAVNLTASTVINMDANVTAAAVSGSCTVSFNGPVVYTGNRTVTNSGGVVASNTSFVSTVNGAGSLSVQAAFGTVTFAGVVGGVTPPSNIIYFGTTLFTNIAADITVSGANPLNFTPQVALTGPSIITTNNAALTFSTTVRGPSSLTCNSGTATTTFTGLIGSVPALGGLTVTSSNAIGLALNNNSAVTSSFTTTSGTTTRLGFAGTTTINTSASGGAIAFGGAISGTTSGAQALTLNAGTGTISLAGVGTALVPLSALTVSTTNTTASALNFAAGDYITNAAQSYATGVGGAMNTAGAVNFTTLTNTPITFGTGTLTPAAGSTVTLTSGTGALSIGAVSGGGTTTLNLVNTGTIATTGAVTIGTLTFTAPTAISIGNNITKLTSGITFPVAVTLTGGSIITTTDQPLSFSSTINGAQTLALAAGTSTVNLSTNVGNSTPLTSLTVTTTNTTAGAVTFGGTIYTTTGLQSYTAGAGGLMNVSGATGFTTTNSNITFATGTMSLAAASNVTLTAGTGAISVGPVSGDSTTALHYINTGAAATTGAINVGTLDFTAPSSISIGNNITTTTSSLTFPAAATLTGSSIITTPSQPIAFSSTINGTSAGAQALTLNAGSGAISLPGVIGGGVRLGAFSMTSSHATGVSIGNGAAGSVTANSFTTTSGTPTTLIFPGTATIDTSALPGNISFGGAIHDAALGTQGLTLTAGGGTITLSDNAGASISLLNLTLSSTNTTSSAITLGGTVYTTTGAQSYTTGVGGQINVSGTTGFTTTNNNITFSTGTLILAPASNITLTAGTGAISVGPVSGNSTTALHFINTGTATTTGSVTVGTLDFTAPSSISIANNITVLTSNLTIPSPGTLTGTSIITTTLGSISFTNAAPFTWASAFNMTLNAGSAISIAGDITSTGVGVNAGDLNFTANGVGAGNYSGVTVNAATVSSAGGSITMVGTGGNTGSGNHGINLTGGSSVTTSPGPGQLSLTGTGGNSDGVQINASTTTTVDGALSIIGTTTGVGTDNRGIAILNGGAVTSTGLASTGTITMNGTGSPNGTTGNHGILVSDVGTNITSATSNIMLTGLADGTSFNNRGISVEAGANIISNGVGVPNLVLTLDGTGDHNEPNSWGVHVGGTGTLISAVDAELVLKGSSPGTSVNGVQITTGAVVQTTGTGSIGLQTNAFLGQQGDISVDTGGRVTSNNMLLVISSRDLLVTGGSGVGESALIQHISMEGHFQITGSVSLTGGSGANAAARIEPIGATAGEIFDYVLGNISLTGGSGSGAHAHIGSTTSNSGDLTFTTVGGTLTLDGSNTNSYAAIGNGITTSALTLSGNIDITTTGDITLQGANTVGGGSFGFAQIGHIDQTGGGSTLSGNITMQTPGSTSILGGTGAATAYAQVGLGGQVPIAGPSTILMLSGVNCTLAGSTGDAIITNNQTTPGVGDITIVVDNLFPTAPTFGPGAFNFGSTITATGELKIYTATRGQNTISPPGIINGLMFTPGTLFVDTTTEEWDTYYPGGTYVGSTAFKFYYKDNGTPPVPPGPLPVPTPSPSDPVISNQGTLADLVNSQLRLSIPPIPFNHWLTNFLFCDFESTALTQGDENGG